MNIEAIKKAIIQGDTSLGIELGSTRIKAILIDKNHTPIASGGYDWENRLENGYWTYPLDAVWVGLQQAYANLVQQVSKKYQVSLTNIHSIGISAMMHGYLVFDQSGKQLVPFRTWRNTTTEQAANLLTKEFGFNVPQRWNGAHLYQAILNNEDHIDQIAFSTTLSGYVHWQLTGQKVLGVGDASGMFPIDSHTGDFNQEMTQKFDALVAKKHPGLKIKEIFPKVLSAGQPAGSLTPEGAKLLDPTGALVPNIPLCPPEGDAGTGMVATNSVAARTGNVSAGTSIFAMVVLEEELSKVYTEIDMVTTPAGKPVAMVHCNNCTTDLDAWTNLFGQVLEGMGVPVDKPALYDMLYFKALEGEPDAGGLLSYNYYSGEPITGLDEGRPLFTRLPDSKLSLANFTRNLLFSTMATLKIGMDILTDQEHVRLEQLLGHGGLFKTKKVGQTLMAGALNVPVSVMESAGEGGAWGIALLAAYMADKQQEETLEAYLKNKVFANMEGTRVEPQKADREGFQQFMERYTKGIAIAKSAVTHLK